jgi:hypothetical protein
LGELLPCVYCRNSFRQANFGKLSIKLKTSINICIITKDGCKRYVWAMHDFVNRKLRNQELEKAGKKGRKAVLQKWKRKMLTFDQALEQRFSKHHIGNPLWWEAMVRATGYMLCDWRPNVGPKLVFLLKCFGTLLVMNSEAKPSNMARRNMADRYRKQLSTVVKVYGDKMQNAKNRNQRFNMLHNFYKGFMPKLVALEVYQKSCEMSIVGCVAA